MDAHEWSTSWPGRFNPGEEPRYTVYRSLGGPQSRSGRFGEEKNLLSLQKFEPRTVQTHYAIPPPDVILYVLYNLDGRSYKRHFEGLNYNFFPSIILLESLLLIT